MSKPAVIVVSFSPAFGLPGGGPFANKLIAWVRLAGVPHTLRYDDNIFAAPKGKNPWAEIDGEPMGDSQLIIERLERELGLSLDEGLTEAQVARGLVIRRMCEEHLHQVFEHEYIVQDAGYAVFSAVNGQDLPGFVRPLLGAYLRSHFRKQLHARGIGRHELEEITRMGRADIDALDALLGDREWFVADRPTLTDCAVWGQLSMLIASELPTAVATHARSKPRLVAFHERMCARVSESAPEADVRLAS